MITTHSQIPARQGAILDDSDPMDEAIAVQSPEELARVEELRQSKIATLTLSIIEKRKKAVDYRQSCGIEQEWMECEDAYEGIDDANRTTENTVSARMQKPRDPNGGAIGGTKGSTGGTRSTVYLNITRPYTDAAAARVSDMLLPSDDRNFALKPTPIPELAATQGMQILPEELQAFRIQLQAEAKKRSDAAQQRIDDWLTQCQYQPELRKVIEDCARLGTGILKGPFPVMSNRKSVSKDETGALQMVANSEISPNSRCVKCWDLYPDPSCGDRVDKGSHVFEKDQVSARQVRELLDQPAYITEALMECLKEGPSKTRSVTNETRVVSEDESYEIWYYTGEISSADFDAVYKQQHDAIDAVRVVITVINDRIVKIAEATLDCEGFGYDLMPWQRRSEMVWGIGIPKQINVPQMMLNAATRGMSDNASISSGPQIVITKGVLKPADGSLEITPRKVWFADPETGMDDIRKAFMAINLETRQVELMNIIQFALKMAEDVTGMPMLMQGNQGQATDTVGGMEILNTNANTVLRRIARTFDDCLTKPHITRYYYWIMTYGDESEKGDFQIDARGSTSLVERDIQMRAILGMGEMVLNPAFGLDPELWAEEALRANKLDPSKLKLTEEKKAAQQQAMQAQAQAEQQAQQTAMALEEKKIDATMDIAEDNNNTKLAIADKAAARAAAQPAPALKKAGGSKW